MSMWSGLCGKNGDMCLTLTNRLLIMWTNLSRWDEVALRGASKRQLLLGNHHHLGAGRIDVSGSNGSWATTRLYPWSTGGHGWSVLIITLANRWGEGRRRDEGQVIAQTNLLLCTFSVSVMEVLAHVCKCCCVCLCVCPVTDTPNLSWKQCTHSDCQYVQRVLFLGYTESNSHWMSCHAPATLRLEQVTRGRRRREKLLPVVLCIHPSAAQHMSREQEREWD